MFTKGFIFLHFLIQVTISIRGAMTLNAGLLEFKAEPLCFMEDRLQYGYSRLLPNFDNKTLSCARACQTDETCVGFSVHAVKDASPTNSSSSTSPATTRSGTEEGCYLHHEYLRNDECLVGDNAETDQYFHRKYGVCSNAGVWREEDRRCDCVPTGNKVGRMCTAWPRHCRDLANAGYPPSTLTIKLKPLRHHDADLVDKYCVVGPGRVTKMAIALNKLTMDRFNRSWVEYENGFQESNNVYWMGLKYLHEIIRNTVEPTTINLAVVARSAYSGHAEYFNVTIGNATDGYRLRYSGHELFDRFAGSPAAFCLMESNGEKFSTFDSDNDDNFTDNCAALNGIGNWFGVNCKTPCNIFGSIYRWTIYGRIFEPYSISQIRMPLMTRRDFAWYFLSSTLTLVA